MMVNMVISMMMMARDFLNFSSGSSQSLSQSPSSSPPLFPRYKSTNNNQSARPRSRTNFSQADPDLLRVALTDADPKLLEVKPKLSFASSLIFIDGDINTCPGGPDQG